MMENWFYILKSYLGFTRREMRGFVFVIPILCLLYAGPFFIERYHHSSDQATYLAYIAENNELLSQKVPSRIDSSQKNQKPSQESKREEKKSSSSSSLKKPSKPSFNKITFSEATAIELQMVQGVGPVLSARIDDYRESLGGFHSPEQILEVYGVDAELAEKIYSVFAFESHISRQLNINSADFKQLIKHPYIDYGATKVILAYRKQHGPYKSAEELLNIKIFNEDWVNRVSPYLTF